MKRVAAIELSPQERAELQRRIRSQPLDAGAVRRAHIILRAAQGKSDYETARHLNISRGAGALPQAVWLP